MKLYAPLSQAGLLQLVPLSPRDGVYAHPPTVLDGEFNPVWTNPNLYGLISLLSPEGNLAYADLMEDMDVQALLLDNHYNWTASGRPGVQANCQLDYADCNITGSFDEYLGRLTSSHRRAVLKNMEQSVVLKDHGSVYDCSLHHDFILKSYTLTEYREIRSSDRHAQNVECYHRTQGAGLYSDDLGRGMFMRMINHLIECQRDPICSYSREVIRNMKVLAVVHAPSKTVVSFHLIGVNYAAQTPANPTVVLHSFARMSLLSARHATTALIKAVTTNSQTSTGAYKTFVDELRHVTHLDITNVGLSEREAFKSDFMTGQRKAPAWASPALLDQKHPFITPL